jgi:hypothetical protein
VETPLSRDAIGLLESAGFVGFYQVREPPAMAARDTKRTTDWRIVTPCSRN